MRKPLNVWAKERRPEFERRLSEFSLTALQNVIDIANKALDPRVRLQANTYLLDKVLGRDFSLNREQPPDNNIVINLVPVGAEAVISEEDAELIRRAEAGEQRVDIPAPDEELWDVGEWGTDVYDPE